MWKYLSVFPPEFSHQSALWGLRALAGLVPRYHAPSTLGQTVFGKFVSSPLGVAAGFDKNGQVMAALARLGAGFCEIGTVTPKAQKGNPRPRLFRLRGDTALINRLGFNNHGHARVHHRLARFKKSRHGACMVGVNLGVNASTDESLAARLDDYGHGVTAFAQLADYLVLNISSPNTKNLRTLHHHHALQQLCSTVVKKTTTPVLVKVSPDLHPQETEKVVEAAMGAGVAGFIVSNTTTVRDTTLQSAKAGQAGGLSGTPLYKRSTELLSRVYRLTHGAVPLIGAGGVATVEDFYGKITAGACLVQLYTSLTYQGPTLLRKLNHGLHARLQQEGFTSITQAVGTAASQRSP